MNTAIQLKSKVAVNSIHKVENGKNGTVGICDLNINGEFTITGVLINKNKDGGLYLKFPYRTNRTRQGTEYADIAHPSTKDTRTAVTELVVESWEANFGDELQAAA